MRANYKSGLSDFPDAGEYNVVVKEVEPYTSKERSYPCWRLKLEITDGDSKGKIIRSNLVNSEKARWFIINFVYSAGLDLEDNEDYNPEDLQGKDLIVRIDGDGEVIELTRIGKGLVWKKKISKQNKASIEDEEIPF